MELTEVTYEVLATGDKMPSGYYMKADVDAAIAELQSENAELKKKLMPCLNGDCILTCEVVEKYGKENAELKAKLEDVQASMYCDVVDANMENRRLKRALWLARAEIARTSAWVFWNRKDDYNYNKWKKVERKCRAKAKEYL